MSTWFLDSELSTCICLILPLYVYSANFNWKNHSWNDVMANQMFMWFPWSCDAPWIITDLTYFIVTVWLPCGVCRSPVSYKRLSGEMSIIYICQSTRSEAHSNIVEDMLWFRLWCWGWTCHLPDTDWFR